MRHAHPGHSGTFIVKCTRMCFSQLTLSLRVKHMMAASSVPTQPGQSGETSLSASVPFDFDRPPIIEGFSPLPRVKDETFKEKFIRKTKENPFVPIGQLHKLRNTETKLSQSGMSYSAFTSDGSMKTR